MSELEPKRPDPCLDCTKAKTNCHKECLSRDWFLDVVNLPDVPEWDVVLWAAAMWDGKKVESAR